MTRLRGPRYSALALALLGMACGDGATAPNVESVFVVSLAGLTAEHAGVVLHLSGEVTDVSPGDPSLEVAWARGPSEVTVVIVGSLTATPELLIVRGRGGELLRAVVREVAGADGSVTSSPPAYAIVRPARTS